MTTYVAVSAVRIQQWIARTPRLILMRGASAALAKHTAHDAIRAWISSTKPPGRPTACEDAGDVSGVVVLELTGDQSQEAEDLARALVCHLATALPAVEWVAWWVAAESYVAAYQSAVTDAEPIGQLTALPDPMVIPPAQRCGGCGQEPAVERRLLPREPHDPDSDLFLGPDCVVRHQHAYPAADPRAAARRVPQTFDELARKTVAPGVRVHGKRDSANHLATIVADGNQIGAVFSLLAGSGNDDLRREASQILDWAARVAVEAAVQAVQEDALEAICPVIVHLIGGDDIAVSLPAPLAWRFVDALMGGFATCRTDLAALVERSEVRDDEDGTKQAELACAVGMVSLGVGITFAQAKHPFDDCRRAASAGERRAKQAVRGRQSAASWIDLTSESSVHQGRVVTATALAADLSGQPTIRTRLMTMNPSARYALAALLPPRLGSLADSLRDTRPDEVRRGEEVVKGLVPAVDRWAERTQHQQVIPWSAHTTSESSPSMEVLMAGLLEISDLLSRARWWPC